MKRIPVIAVLVLGLGGCVDDGFQADLLECRCDLETCPESDCRVDVVFEASCVGQLDKAEVWFDGHIEAALAVPGQSLRTCSRIPWRGSSSIAVRGGDWIWGHLDEPCDEARSVKTVLLQCVESGGAE